MIPRLVSPVRRENIPRPITTTPTDLKKRGACRDRANDTDPNERSANTGNVPSAKKSIIRSHQRNEPLESAEICIDWVNPQGRKNVPIPMSRGPVNVPSFFLKNEKRELGSVMAVFLKTPTRLNHRVIITSAAMIQSMEEKTTLIPMVLPIIPSIHPRSAKPSILPE